MLWPFVVIFLLLIYPIWNFWWIEERLWRRISASMLVIVALGLLGRVSWPQPNGRPAVKDVHSSPRLKVTGYEILPYSVGQKFTVKMHVSSPPSPLNVFASYYPRIAHDLSGNDEARRQLEDSLWLNAEDLIKANHQILTIPSGGPTYLSLESTPLTQTDVDRLRSGSVLYVMTIILGEDRTRLLESCIHTEQNSIGQVVNCMDHNYGSSD